jgi:hypothetical protein
MKFRRIPSCILLLVLLTGCAARSGTYSFSITKTDSLTKAPLIYGEVFEYDTKLPSFGFIWPNKEPHHLTSELGKYAFELRPGKYRFTGGYLGYFSIRTKSLKISNGEQVKVDFYLKSDPSPLHKQ